MNGENQGDTVLILAKLFVALCLFIFVVVLGEDTFRSMFIEPTYSKEELLAKMEERKRLRNQDRLENLGLVENGIHVNTGLMDDDNLEVVIQSCLSCHSAKLITQNQATREGWQDMIRWMQETQGLGDCLLYTSPSPRDLSTSRMPSSA